jgi:hypothetical protein
MGIRGTSSASRTYKRANGAQEVTLRNSKNENLCVLGLLRGNSGIGVMEGIFTFLFSKYEVILTLLIARLLVPAVSSG